MPDRLELISLARRVVAVGGDATRLQADSSGLSRDDLDRRYLLAAASVLAGLALETRTELSVAAAQDAQ